MGAPLGCGRKEVFGFIEDLTISEKGILKVLMTWNHQLKCADYMTIAAAIGSSNSTAYNGLKTLERRGIVLKSAGKCWALKPEVKQKLLDELSVGLLAEGLPSKEQPPL
jgi:hypothetical protein